MPEHAVYLSREWNIELDQRVKVSNAELRYAVLGKGEPVLCIHGTSIADSLITPLRFFPPLFDDYKLISYYRAGYNGSTLTKSALSIEEGAAHSRQLLDHLGIDKAHIVAFSFGGVIGFQFLLDYPEQAHSAVLLEPYLPREEPAAVQANIDAFVRANELYQQGDKLGAAQLYMELVCGPSFLGAVEMTNPLDVWRRVEECVDTTFNVDFAAINAWGFRMSQADRDRGAQARDAGIGGNGDGQRICHARFPGDATLPDELAAAGGALRDHERDPRDAKHEPARRRRGDLYVSEAASDELSGGDAPVGVVKEGR